MIRIIFPKCVDCGRMDVVLLKHKNEDGETELKCNRCVNPNQLQIGDDVTKQDKDMYIVKWRLCDKDGKEWVEQFDEMSLAEFEVVYGNNIHEIIWMQIRLKNRAMI